MSTKNSSLRDHIFGKTKDGRTSVHHTNVKRFEAEEGHRQRSMTTVLSARAKEQLPYDLFRNVDRATADFRLELGRVWLDTGLPFSVLNNHGLKSFLERGFQSTIGSVQKLREVSVQYMGEEARRELSKTIKNKKPCTCYTMGQPASGRWRPSLCGMLI